MLRVDTTKQSAPRIGPAYQAVLPPPPPLLNNSGAACDESCSSGETLMWSPRWELSEEQLDTYLRTCSSSAAANGTGITAEEALRILAMCRGDFFQVR
jgi:ELM2 domain